MSDNDGALVINITEEMLEAAIQKYKETHPHWRLYPITNEYQISRGEVTPQCEPLKDIIKTFLRDANNNYVIRFSVYAQLLEFLDDYTFG